MASRRRARPRNLLIGLVLVTAAAIGALTWLGWVVLRQEREVETQRGRDRVEIACDAAVVRLKAWIARTGEELSALIDQERLLWPPATARGLTVVFGRGDIRAFPAPLLFQPGLPAIQSPHPALAAGEPLERNPDTRGRAERAYRLLSRSDDPSVRAEAWLRLGRLARAAGDEQGALHAFEALSAETGTRLDAGPAALVGRAAALELRPDPAAASALRDALFAGTWPLTRGEFEFYWSRVAAGRPADHDRWRQAIAAADVWTRWRNGRAVPVSVLRIEGTPHIAVQRTLRTGLAARIVSADAMLVDVCGDGLQCAISDRDGTIAGGVSASHMLRASLPSLETQLPFDLTVAIPLPVDTFTRRQALLVAQIAATAVLLVAGAFFIGRAIRQDAETARLQTQFLATVSHEFRSPLTALRQLSEMLAFDRVPSDERRRTYYQGLLDETGRLQGLVETLLDFGRMEAGPRQQFQMQPVDVAELVSRVTAEFTARLTTTGRTIEVHPPAVAVQITADPNALALALRNLIDNALKYSPGEGAVRIDWTADRTGVTIRVHDSGMGIAADERTSVFGRFARGRAAIAAGIQGTGLGLAMVEHIVVLHGGRIGLESEEGRGSTFSIVLPVDDSA